MRVIASIAAALLLTIFVVYLLGPSRSFGVTEVPYANLQTQANEPEPAEVAQVDLSAMRKEAPQAVNEPPEQESPLRQSEVGEALLTGRVWGFISGLDGLPASEHWLTFLSKADDFDAGACTDVDGAYEIEVPYGEYTLRYGGLHPSQGAVSVGEFRLQAPELRYDPLISGLRTLTGNLRLFIPGDPETALDNYLLELELRRASYPYELVAEGGTAARRTPRLAPNGEPVKEVNAPWESVPPGWFRFEGLPPETYTLRIICGQNAAGEDLFVDREIDLAQGDLTLEPEIVDIRDFLPN